MFPPMYCNKMLVKWSFIGYFSFSSCICALGILIVLVLLEPLQPRKHGDMSPPVRIGVCKGF